MTAKEKFLAVYPMAQIWPPSTGGDVYRIVRFVGDTDYITGETEEAAWQNAAESLPAQPRTFTDADDEAHMDGHARMILGESVESLPTQKKKCENCNGKGCCHCQGSGEAELPAQPGPKICTCPTSQWIGSEPNDSTCILTEEEHSEIERQSLPAQPEQEDAPMMDYEIAGKEAYAEQRVVIFRAMPTGQKFAAHPEGHYIALTKAPVEAKEKDPETTKIPCYEVYDAKDIDCTVFQHERMNDLQEFVYQLLDGLEDGESIRIEFKNYTQEELDEVYDEL